MLQCVDGRVEGTWQAKGSWSKALDFLTEALRFALFLMFFGIIFTFYGNKEAVHLGLLSRFRGSSCAGRCAYA